MTTSWLAPDPTGQNGQAGRNRPRRRVVFWLAVAASLVLLGGGGFVAVTDYLKSPSPAQVVTGYYEALADGDAAKALSFGPPPAGTRAYLSADVLRAQLKVASFGPVGVTGTARTGSRAIVKVAYPLHYAHTTVTVHDQVPLVRSGRRWRLAESAVASRVGLAQAGRRALFAQTAFPDDSVALFPGALPITFDTPNLELTTAGAAVLFSATDHTGLAVTPSPAGMKAVRAAVTAGITSCLAGPPTNLPLCPLPNGSGVRAVPGSLRGVLKPGAADGLTVTVTPDADGLITVSGSVEVAGQYQSLDFDNIATATTTATIPVPVSAQCYASAITSLTWTEQ